MRTLRRFLKIKLVWASFGFITLFPIIINFAFLTWRTKVTFGSDNDWIAFFACYYGAIFGGIISGTITLIGVLEGFKKTDLDKFESTYYDRKAVLFDEISKLQSAFVNIKHMPIDKRITEYREKRILLFDTTEAIKKHFNSSYRLYAIMLKSFDNIIATFQFMPLEDTVAKCDDTAMRFIMALQRLEKELDRKYDDILRD